MTTRNPKPFTPADFKKIYSQVPRVTAEAVIKTPKGIILVKRSLPDWQGMWHIPGVTLLYGEKLAQAVNRAAQDEAGVSITITGCLGPYEFSNETRIRGWGQTVGIAYLCETTDSVPSQNQDGEEIGVFQTVPEHTIAEQIPIIQRILNS